MSIEPEARLLAEAPGDLEALRALLGGRRSVALTGAGCSTESGIPDYRGAGRAGPKNPIQHDAFIRRADVRQRYWARATLGWERFKDARPNAAHLALAALEEAGLLTGVITQNVDRLPLQRRPRTAGRAAGAPRGREPRLAGPRRRRARARRAGRPPPRRRRRAVGRDDRRLRRGRLRRLRWPAQARGRLLRRQRPRGDADARLGHAGERRGAAGGGVVADRLLRVPLRAPRPRAGPADRDRQPRSHARRPPGAGAHGGAGGGGAVAARPGSRPVTRGPLSRRRRAARSGSRCRARRPGDPGAGAGSAARAAPPDRRASAGFGG